MNRNHEQDEFVAVRVQDPRIQNEGSWNSYVDYKIFLHTNSKAFTAKTSCVRRRYSEFEWLRRKMQKNAGLAPVPDLPGKSFFSFSNDDFLERRRKGLQAFLDKVVHTTVCLSDSQLHLFLQTQLPIGHIQDCVQGHTPYSVTDAILTYASSNRGLAQAQEDDPLKEPSLTVSYESMESPAPHQPCPQTNETFSPELLACDDSDPLEGLLERRDQNSAETQRKKKSTVRISQNSNLLEAVVEDFGPKEATFYLGESQDDTDCISPAEQMQQMSCQIQTPVVVHSPIGAEFEEDCVFEEEPVVTLDTEGSSVAHPDSQEEKNGDQVDSEPEKCENSESILGFTNANAEEEVIESNAISQEEESIEGVCSESHIVENHVICEVNESHILGVSSDNEKSESESKEEMPLLHSEIQSHNVNGVAEVESSDDDIVKRMQVVVGTKDESDDDSHSLPSSIESIVKVSDEESACEEAEDSIQTANVYVKMSAEDVTCWSEVEVSSRNILDLQMNGCPLEKDDDVSQDEYVQHNILSKSLDLNSAVSDGDLTENSDIRILETSSVPGLAVSKCLEQEALSSLSLDAAEETKEVDVL